MMLEVYDNNITVIMEYYGNETAPLGHFPFNFELINKLTNRTQLSGHSLFSIVTLWLDNLPEGKWPNWVVSIPSKCKLI